MHVSKHFSTPHTNTSLSLNKPLNNKSTMGFKLGRVVDDQMPMSNLLLHNSKNCWELRHKLTSLFPHLYGRISGCHNFPNFTWMASHNKPFTSRTKRCHSLLGLCDGMKQCKCLLANQTSPLLLCPHGDLISCAW
jgi:hypothetical protein